MEYEYSQKNTDNYFTLTCKHLKVYYTVWLRNIKSSTWILQIWKEYPNGMQSNYLSGAAGYLQVLMYGYGGLRIHPEHL